MAAAGLIRPGPPKEPGGQEMIVIGGFGLGAILGALTARRRGGKAADMAQYAAAYGIAFALLGLFLTIAIARGSAP